jgi:hypothetical protein
MAHRPNYPRLAAVKAVVDPNGLLIVHHALGVYRLVAEPRKRVTRAAVIRQTIAP